MFSRFAQLFQNPLQLLYTLPAIIIGLTVHEWAHAYAAYRLGDPTARNLGRMTINPLAHIDLIGFAMLLLVGFGWAKPVPVNPRNFKNYKRDDIFGSIITINLALGIFNLIPIYPLDGSHVLESLLVRKIPRFFMFLRQYGQWILLALLLLGIVSTVLGYLVSGVTTGFFSVAAWFVNLF